jgi:hypothetical protein
MRTQRMLPVVVVCLILASLGFGQSIHRTDPFEVTIETLSIGDATNPCEAQPTDQADMQALASWIDELQYTDPFLPSYGAIKIHHDPAALGRYGPYYRVVPYHSNLAVAGLLRAPIPGKFAVAEPWIEWQLRHINKKVAPGVVFDHWYYADGSGETTCPEAPDTYCNHSDSFGSTAATLLGVTWTYYAAGGSAPFLRTPGKKELLERVAAVILGLQQPDGLVSENAPLVRYLMDNSEIYWGLKSMESLEARVFLDRSASQVYARAAARVQDAIRNSLLNPITGLYRVAKLDEGVYWEADLNEWYPGTVSLLWPSLFYVTQGNSKIERAQVDALNAVWDGSPKPDWTSGTADPSGFLWPSIGYAAMLAGDCGRARAQVNQARAAKFPGVTKDLPFSWPFPVDDAGWLLSTLSLFSQSAR